MTNENKTDDDNPAMPQHRVANFDTTPSYTSSIFVNIQQLQGDLQVQHHHEKHALTELNQRLRRFIDRMQQLEAQNANYVAQIISLRDSSYDLGDRHSEWNNFYLKLQSDLFALSHDNIDFELEVEMYPLQIATYQGLINVEQHWKNEQHLKLEQELNQSSLTLNNLRGSKTGLETEVKNLYGARDDAYQRYLRLTYDWSRVKKLTKEWEFNVQLLKKQISFYNNLRSYSGWSIRIVFIFAVLTDQLFFSSFLGDPHQFLRIHLMLSSFGH